MEEKVQDEALDKIKSNIINWYNFENTERICIVGNIDKIIVKYLSIKFKEVVLYENLETKSNFDYILINNLNSDNSVETLSKKLVDYFELLTNTGKILLVQKNALGSSNMVKSSFCGIDKIKLDKIIKNANLKARYYYVLPEKLQTNVIISEDFKLSSNDLRRNNHFSKERNEFGLLENKLLSKLLENNNQDFKYCANTFFVELSKTEIKNDIQAVFFNNMRPEEYRLKTILFKDKAIKEAVSKLSENHIKTIKQNIEILEKCKLNSLDICENNKIISTVLENGKRFDDEFLKKYKIDINQALQMINQFKNEILLKLNIIDSEDTVFQKYGIEISESKLNEFTFVKYGLWDLTFQNVFIKEGEYYIYDQEWCEYNIPVEFILYRSILILDGLSDKEKDNLLEKLNLIECKELFFELETKIQLPMTNEPMLELYKNTLVDNKYVEYVETEDNNITKKDNFKKRIIKMCSNVAFKFMTKKYKRKLRTKIEYSKNLSQMLDIPMIDTYNKIPMKLCALNSNRPENVLSQLTLNKSIGIQLYINNENVINEIYNYLSNIPYEFDLYISLEKHVKMSKVKRVLKNIINLNTIEFKYKKDLKQYDYVMYVSTTSEDKTRKYLLDNLLGSREKIMKIFYLMEQKNVGIVYPDASKDISCWNYTWENEQDIAKEVCQKLGIEYSERFLEFPLEGMFWAKSKAIEPVLDLYNDDINKNILEKVLGLVVKSKGYNIAIYNENKKAFLLNLGIKNLDKNCIKSLELGNYSLDIVNKTIVKEQITNKKDVYNAFEIVYQGTLGELLCNNLGVKNAKILTGLPIELPIDFNLVKKIIDMYYMDEILRENTI